MQNLLWIGNPCFAEELQNCGWERVAIHQPGQFRMLAWQDILRLADFTPDVLVVADGNLPPYLDNPETFPCLTVFYSASSHIHPWHQLFAQAFDACMVSLRDSLESFQGINLTPDRIWWFPPYAKKSTPYEPQPSAEWDCVFAGDTSLPIPQAFMEEVRKLVPGLQCPSGKYEESFARGRVILNHAFGNELNFRFFEALGSGGCVVSPRVNNGLERLFVDGEHFVGYAPDDPGDAAWKINYLLKYPELVSHIRQTGHAEVNARHLAAHRAEALTDHLCDLFLHGSGLVQARLEKAEEIRRDVNAAYLKAVAETEDESIKNSLLGAANEKNLV